MLAKGAIHSLPAAKVDAAKYWRVARARLHLWLQRRREREELASMTELELKDLGLVPADRRSLLDAPFWKCYPFAGDDEAGATRDS